MQIDKTDARILERLQADSRITNSELSEYIGMSTSPCWRRVKQLEEAQVIKGYGVLIDRKKIGLGVMVFIRVSIDSHSEKEARKFEEEVIALEHVVLVGMQIFYYRSFLPIWILTLNFQCQ